MSRFCLDDYLRLDEVADRLGIIAEDKVEAARMRCQRRQIPTEDILGTRMVLKASLEEAMKRARRRA